MRQLTMAWYSVLACIVILLGIIPELSVQQKGSRRPPKIVTKEGSIVLKAGEDGDIVLEPDDGHQVRIGSFVLNANSSSPTKGPKGDKGDNGTKGSHGLKGNSGISIPGMKGNKGNQGIDGLHGVQGSKGEKGHQGMDGMKGNPGSKGDMGLTGPQGLPGPPGLEAEAVNITANKRCNNTSDYGQMKYMDNNLQVCTPVGWKRLAFKDDVCDPTSVPKINLEYFKRSYFGVLFQFNGNLRVDFSPESALMKYNLTTVFEDNGSNSSTPPNYVDSAMGKAIQLKGRQHINLHGLPMLLWSKGDWSVMALIKFSEEALNTPKEIALIGSGVKKANKGFHLGIKNKKILYSTFSDDLVGVTELNYDQWYQITWTYKNFGGERQIFINGIMDTSKKGVTNYKGDSLNTEIGAWWDDTVNRPNNIQIDTLFIIDKVVDYHNSWSGSDWMELCQAKLADNYMP